MIRHSLILAGALVAFSTGSFAQSGDVAYCGRLSEAYRDFGKGSGHKAQLNFGDCFAYALSKARGEPLLFKGDDFRKTDVEAAL